jgi:hypothetical protein
LASLRNSASVVSSGWRSRPDPRRRRSQARNLVWLRDRLGDTFVGGVLHTGRHVYRLDDKIVAAPICTIWA